MRQLATYSNPLSDVKTKALRTLIENDDRIVGFSIEKDEGRVFIYTDSTKWCDGAGSGTFSGRSESEAVRCFKAEVQVAETPEQQAEAIWTRSTENDRRVILAKRNMLPSLALWPFSQFTYRTRLKLIQAMELEGVPAREAGQDKLHDSAIVAALDGLDESLATNCASWATIDGRMVIATRCPHGTLSLYLDGKQMGRFQILEALRGVSS